MKLTILDKRIIIALITVILVKIEGYTWILNVLSINMLIYRNTFSIWAVFSGYDCIYNFSMRFSINHSLPNRLS